MRTAAPGTAHLQRAQGRGFHAPLPLGATSDAYVRLAHDLREIHAEQFDRVPDRIEEGIEVRDEFGIDVVFLDQGIIVDRKSTRLNSSHGYISYAVFCLKKKK